MPNVIKSTQIPITAKFECIRSSKTQCQRGFTLVEILVAVGILSILGLGIASLMNQLSKGTQNSVLMSNIRFELERYLGAIRSLPGWDATVNHASNTARLRCLRAAPATAGDCFTDLDPPPPSPPALPNPTTFVETLFSPDGGTIIYRRDASAFPLMTNGFRSDGVPCHLDNAAVPTAACPIGLRFWVYHNACAGAGCLQPPVMIETVLTPFNGPQTPKLNFNNYRFRVSKTGMTDLSQFCTSLHGTISLGPPVTCNFNQNRCDDVNGDGVKDSGLTAFMVGFNADWDVMCSSNQCPAGQVITGISAGNPVCGAPPTGSVSCGANQLMEGVSRNPATGSVTPICSLDTVPQGPANQCAAGFAPTGIDSQGKATGCTKYHQGEYNISNPNPENFFIQGIKADGVAVVVPKITTDCGLGAAVRKIHPNGTPECMPVNNTSCNVGETVTGFDATTGARICTPLPARPTMECQRHENVAEGVVGVVNMSSDAGATGSCDINGGWFVTGGGGYCEGSVAMRSSGPKFNDPDPRPISWFIECAGVGPAPYTIRAYDICCRVN